MEQDKVKLTSKQEMFCLEYIVDFNATQAAIRAGYKPDNARQMATENLAKPALQAKIGELIDKRAQKTQVNAEYVLMRLHEIDTLDVLDIVNKDLKGFKPLNEWPKSWRISINAMDIKKLANSDGEAIEAIVEKIKWPDKTRNLELLGKHVNVNAFTQAQENDDVGDPLNITFNVSESVKDIKVTSGA